MIISSQNALCATALGEYILKFYFVRLRKDNAKINDECIFILVFLEGFVVYLRFGVTII